jgi:hypothetical protein
VTSDFTHPNVNAEIEDKCRLPDELAARISRRLDTGIRMHVPGWGRHSIRPLGVSRIIDRYYDTPDQMFQTWSKTHRKQLLLRERHEGTVIGDVNPQNIRTREQISMIPVADETHTLVVKVPLDHASSQERMRTAREHVVIYTEQDGEALKAHYIEILQGILGVELNPTTIDIRESVGKVRTSYGVLSRPTFHAPETLVIRIDLDFVVREYYGPEGISVERYAKYEAEKQGSVPIRQFETCAQHLRAVLHIPHEVPSHTIPTLHSLDE